MPSFRFHLQDSHPLRSIIPHRFDYLITDHLSEALQPHTTEVAWFGLYPVRSPLLGVSQLISLPSGTEMFHFPEFASQLLYIQSRIKKVALFWVSPFGNPRIKVC